MSLLYAYLSFAFVVCLVIYNLFIVRKGNKSPPGIPEVNGFSSLLIGWTPLQHLGPLFRLPIFGHAIQAGSRPYLSFTKWAQAYGDIFEVEFGTKRGLVLNDHKLVKEMFSDPTYSGRIQHPLAHIIPRGPYGIVISEKETWESQRRFALRHLRDFGFGKSSLECLILEEANQLVSSFKKYKGEPLDIRRKFSLAVLNTLWRIVSGKSVAQNDPTILEILNAFERVGEELNKSVLLFFAPWLLKVAPKFTGYERFVKFADSFGHFIHSMIEDHKLTFLKNEQCRDFIDAYLTEIKDITDKNSPFYKETGVKNLFALLGDLFTAGAEPMSSTLSWAMLYLAGHPDIQRKLHAEIDSVIGNDSLPTLDHRSRMPYTQAVIMEVLRKSSIVPLGMFHTPLSTKEFHGYEIKKWTWISANLWGIHHNPKIWGDPEVFRPERFLSKDEKGVERNPALMPFLVGKRSCLGESFARDTLFLFIASIFQTFFIQLYLPKGETPNYEASVSFLLNPQKFEVTLTERL